MLSYYWGKLRPKLEGETVPKKQLYPRRARAKLANNITTIWMAILFYCQSAEATLVISVAITYLVTVLEAALAEAPRRFTTPSVISVPPSRTAPFIKTVSSLRLAASALIALSMSVSSCVSRF